MDKGIRTALIAGVIALSVLAGAPAAGASVTLGQVPSGTTLGCNGNEPDGVDWVQPSVTSGNSYVAPVAGTITSWDSDAGFGTIGMKMFRHVSGLIYSVVGHDGPFPMPGGPYPASIPVKAGDILGLFNMQTNGGCSFEVPGEAGAAIYFGGLADNEAETFMPASNRLNVTAVLVPTNTFTLGAVTRRKKKGTATISVDLPNPGQLVASGAGVAGAVTADGSGAVQLPIRAKGSKKRKLNRTGKVRVAPSITFTPTGGDPSTQATTLKLRKN
jgi:hypothetical protein